MLLNDRYELIDELGRGSQGITHRALDTRTGEHVALKSLYVSQAADWKTVELFERQTEALKTIDHPAVPTHIDAFSTEDGGDVRLYMVQQLVQGQNLKERLQSLGPMDAIGVRKTLEALLEALSALHRRAPPIVHRDIKPSNILIDEDGKHFLIDFGAVQVSIQATVGGSTVIGTPGFMPMEQLIGRAEPASDLYSLGVTLCHLWTGVDPTAVPMRDNKLDYASLLPMDTALARTLVAMIEPSIERRPRTAEDILSLLQQDAPKPTPEPPPSNALAPSAERGADRWHQRAIEATCMEAMGFELSSWRGAPEDLGALWKDPSRKLLDPEKAQSGAGWEALDAYVVRPKDVPDISYFNVDGAASNGYDAFRYHRSADGTTLYREQQFGLVSPRFITFMQDGSSVVTGSADMGSGASPGDIRTVVEKGGIQELFKHHREGVARAKARGAVPLTDIPVDEAWAWEMAAKLPTNLTHAQANHARAKAKTHIVAKILFFLFAPASLGILPLGFLFSMLWLQRAFKRQRALIDDNDRWTMLPELDHQPMTLPDFSPEPSTQSQQEKAAVVYELG